MRPKQKTNTAMLELIKKSVETITGCNILEDTRKKEYVQARNLFYHFARRNRLTFDSIGKYVNRDHATVIHGLKKFKQDVKYDFFYRGQYRSVNELMGELEQGDCENATDNLLEAYDMRNRSLMAKNLELQLQVKELSKDRVDNIEALLKDLPKDRVEFFINNQLKSFISMETAVMNSNAKREAQREQDKKDKEAFRLASLEEDGTGRRGDARNFTYLSI